MLRIHKNIYLCLSLIMNLNIHLNLKPDFVCVNKKTKTKIHRKVKLIFTNFYQIKFLFLNCHSNDFPALL